MGGVFVTLESFQKNSLATSTLEKAFTSICFAKKRELALEEIREKGGKLDALIIGVKERIDSKILDFMPNLKILGTVSTGLDHVDTEELSSRGIKLISAKGVNADAVAEHCLMMMLALLKNAFEAHNAAIAGRDRAGISGLPKDLRKKRVGILGAGDSAKALIRLLKPFECRVNVWTPHPERHRDIGAMGSNLTSLDSLFRTSDIVSLHLALSPETRGIVSKDRILSLQGNAVLVNVARKELFDLSDLKDSLAVRPDIRIGIDDFGLHREDFLETIKDRCILSPHLAGVTDDSLRDMELVVARDVSELFFENGNTARKDD